MPRPVQPPSPSPTPNTPSLSVPSFSITLVLTHVALVGHSGFLDVVQTNQAHSHLGAFIYTVSSAWECFPPQRSRVPSLNSFLPVPNVTYCHLTNICVYTYINGSLTVTCQCPALLYFCLSAATMWHIFVLSLLEHESGISLICSVLDAMGLEWHIVCLFPTDSKCHLYHVLDPCLQTGVFGDLCLFLGPNATF